MRFCILGLVFFILQANILAVTVVFSPNATVRDTQIRLRDIATIEGTDKEKTQLQEMVVGVSPVVGSMCELTYGTVRLKLRQNGIQPDTVTFAGATSVKVTRAATAIDGATIASIGQTWLQEQIPTGESEELVLTPVRLPNDLTLPEGKIAWQCESSGNEHSATRYVTINISIDAKPVWHGIVGYKVERYAQVLVAKGQISRGTTVNDTLVTLERRDIASLAGTPVRDISQFQGYQFAATITLGTIITAEKFEKIPLVKQNDIVRVHAATGALMITLMAVACEDGAEGSTIRVRNQQSREIFEARVSGPGELTMDL